MPKLKEFVKRAVGADGLEGHFVVVVARPDMSILFSKADTFT